ncbi:hypothetical protein C942_00004 [Photobacterium marinum]|uniref:Uncharacterized protein n=1 Tax=Photobacterium marinum TaxID=1056511 RepID=L8JJU3_9GAMM|nr:MULTISPECIES: hypothetical protein [Photobacterium]ELR67697.1 hypothetical protein C942_00004 [Photobacterium marinum]
MSFSDYLDDFIKQRDQQSKTAAPGKRTFQRQPVIQDATSQSVAREAIAKAQEEASERASFETKAAHTRVNGRCVLESEAHNADQLKPQAKPADPDRVRYIQQLRKDLKLKKRQS